MIKTTLSTVIGGAFWTHGVVIIGGSKISDTTPLMWSLVGADLMWSAVDNTPMWQQ